MLGWDTLGLLLEEGWPSPMHQSSYWLLRFWVCIWNSLSRNPKIFQLSRARIFEKNMYWVPKAWLCISKEKNLWRYQGLKLGLPDVRKETRGLESKQVLGKLLVLCPPLQFWGERRQIWVRVSKNRGEQCTPLCIQLLEGSKLHSKACRGPLNA